MNAKKLVQIRLSGDMYRQLRSLAEIERRSTGAQAAFLIERILENPNLRELFRVNHDEIDQAAQNIRNNK